MCFFFWFDISVTCYLSYLEYYTSVLLMSMSVYKCVQPETVSKKKDFALRNNLRNDVNT